MTIYDHMMSYSHYHTPDCHTLYGIWLEILMSTKCPLYYSGNSHRTQPRNQPQTCISLKDYRSFCNWRRGQPTYHRHTEPYILLYLIGRREEECDFDRGIQLVRLRGAGRKPRRHQKPSYQRRGDCGMDARQFEGGQHSERQLWVYTGCCVLLVAIGVA
jgi:hypothetical protein